MAISGTYAFNPTAGELVLNAYARINVRRAEILATHMQDARLEMNLLLAEFANRQVNLWEVDLQTVSLTQGTSTYTVPAETVMILDAYVSYGSPSTDRMIFPISRTEYASFPDKTTQNVPSVFWFDRLIAPTITLWAVPDGNGPYTLRYYRCRQTQDVNYVNGQTVEIPYIWLDVFAAGLAYRLARIYAPQLRNERKLEYDEAWNIAATQNVENVPLYIGPGISGYYR